MVQPIHCRVNLRFPAVLGTIVATTRARFRRGLHCAAIQNHRRGLHLRPANSCRRMSKSSTMISTPRIDPSQHLLMDRRPGGRSLGRKRDWLPLEQARAQAKEFVWPALELANIYSPGAKRADKKKSAEELEVFFAGCPASTDRRAQWPMDPAGTSELQLRAAAALRARLATETATETDPKRLTEYATL